jgi:membrane protein DedA with SNARE-associated domain
MSIAPPVALHGGDMLGLLLCYLSLTLILTAEEAGAFVLPGDISLVAAGVVARSVTNPLVTWVAATSGMVVGATILFALVRRYRHARAIVPTWIGNRMEHHGVFGIAIARLIPGLRNATVVAAAASPLPYHIFLAGLLPATFLWAGLLLGLGYVGGPHLLAVFTTVEHSLPLRLLSLSITILTAALVIVRFVTQHKRAIPTQLSTR